MNLWISRLLACAMLAGPFTAQASITFSTDTATDLVGTFAVTGTTVESANPGAFDFGLSFCMPVRVSRSTTATVGLQCAGSPDDPRVSLQVGGAQSVAGVSGMTDALAGSSVPAFYFRFSDLQDSGGTGGTFS